MGLVEDIRAVTSLLIDSTIGFGVLALGVLIFIFFYLYIFKRGNKKNIKLANLFYTLVSEISLCETDEEREQVFLQPYVQDMLQTCLRRKRRRSLMLKALVQFHKTVHGAAAENIKWLYEKLGFKNDSLQQLTSHRWHKKAAAIQALAEMGQQDCITKVYRYTNHGNYYIRSAAQVAVVKLTGFEGLRFLNVINQPITQWQQLCLLQQLAFHPNIQEEKLQAWLMSANESVVELALKLVKAYAVHGVHDQLVQCLQHPSVIIRIEVIMILKDVATATTVPILKTHYENAERIERIAILKSLQAIGTRNEVPFLAALLNTPDLLLKTEVQKTLQELAPDWQTYKNNNAINLSKSIAII
jgi:HEAT repeats